MGSIGSILYNMSSIGVSSPVAYYKTWAANLALLNKTIIMSELSFA
jgi:hypothetical protein